MERLDLPPEPATTIGAVHWGALTAGTDGERIVLIVPAFFESHHVPYLTGVLEARLTELFGDSVELELQPGRRTESRTATQHEVKYDRGAILMRGVSRPWPDANALRAALEDAFKEAGEIELRQMQMADELVEHLRANTPD